MKFNHKIGIFLKNLNLTKNTPVGLVAKSSAFVTAGDLVAFDFPETKHDYPNTGTFRLSLVVRAYGGFGFTILGSGTAVLCAFQLQEAPPIVVAMILKRLYKNQGACSYQKVIQNLGYLLGSKNFRTFGVFKIQQLTEITLKRSDIAFPDFSIKEFSE